MFNKAVPELPDNIIDQFYHGQEISLLSFLKVHRGYAALMSEGFSLFLYVWAELQRPNHYCSSRDWSLLSEAFKGEWERKKGVDKGSVVPVTKSHKE